MVVSINRGPQYGPQNTRVLIIGTPEMVPLIFETPHILKELFLEHHRASGHAPADGAVGLHEVGES